MTMDQFFHSLQNEQKPASEFPGPFITKLLIPGGSLLLAVVGLLAGYEKLPPWALWLIMLYLVVVTLAIAAYPIRLGIGYCRTAWKKRQLAQRFYRPLKMCVTKLQELTSESRVNALPSLLNEVNGWPQFRDNPSDGSRQSVPSQAVLVIAAWLDSIQRRLNEPRSPEFPALVQDFSSLLVQYLTFCEDARRDLQNKVSWSAQDQQIKSFKSRWNCAREELTHLVKTWEQSARDINTLTGDSWCHIYYRSLTPLE